MPFAAGVQRIIDEEFADGHRYYTKEAHVAELTDDAIDMLLDFWKDMPMSAVRCSCPRATRTWVSSAQKPP